MLIERFDALSREQIEAPRHLSFHFSDLLCDQRILELNEGTLDPCRFLQRGSLQVGGCERIHRLEVVVFNLMQGRVCLFKLCPPPRSFDARVGESLGEWPDRVSRRTGRVLGWRLLWPHRSTHRRCSDSRQSLGTSQNRGAKIYPLQIKLSEREKTESSNLFLRSRAHTLNAAFSTRPPIARMMVTLAKLGWNMLQDASSRKSLL